MRRVSRSPRPTNVTMPATNVCDSGWTLEYSGHLMDYSPYHSSGHDYVCVDSALEDRASSSSDDDGLLLLYMFAKGGSLSCQTPVQSVQIECKHEAFLRCFGQSAVLL